VNEWLQYQALWDASITDVITPLEKDFKKWEIFLNDIRNARLIIDSYSEDDDSSSFGPIIIRHKQVQIKINIKYDNWQKECQTRFATLVITEMKSFYSMISTYKTQLENINLEGITKDAIFAIGFLISMKNNLSAMNDTVDSFLSSEKLLKNQRFTFPSEWLSSSNLIGLYSSMKDILDRRLIIMNNQLPILQQKIKEEDHSLTNRTEKFIENWNLNKPIEGNKYKPK
jgi:dynein heavy chain 1